MSDIRGTPGARILLAKLDLQIDEQHLVLEQKELRLLELDEEQARVQSDIEDFEARGKAATADGAKAESGSVVARKAGIKAHELALLVKGKRIRLLELDEERQQIAGDKDAAAAHITKLEAEVGQQKTRLKETSGG